VSDKSRVCELAMFGGRPCFDEPIHVGRPTLKNSESFLRRVGQVLATHRFTNNGPFVEEFEERIGALTGSRYCVVTCNATTALQLLARALDLRGQIIVPSFTFVATAHAFSWLGLEPVFCDIESGGYTIDPRAVEKVIGPRCSAIVGVHTWGIPCDIVGLERLARDRQLMLIFDAAHALGCEYQGKPIGSRGDATVFSFHATKFVHSFEGGAITTDSHDLAGKLRLMRDFGFAGVDEVQCLGTNAKMSELHAAAGLSSLEAMKDTIRGNRRCFEKYRSLLEAVPGITLVDVAQKGEPNYQYVVLETGPTFPISRDLLLRILQAEGVLARRYFFPGCHRCLPYAAAPRAPLPATEALSDRILVLPTGPLMDDSTIETVVNLLRFVVQHSNEITALGGMHSARESTEIAIRGSEVVRNAS
jgi:dTDP-4-amino-4,6-dideoxygalactose transaminase